MNSIIKIQLLIENIHLYIFDNKNGQIQNQILILLTQLLFYYIVYNYKNKNFHLKNQWNNLLYIYILNLQYIFHLFGNKALNIFQVYYLYYYIYIICQYYFNKNGMPK